MGSWWRQCPRDRATNRSRSCQRSTSTTLRSHPRRSHRWRRQPGCLLWVIDCAAVRPTNASRQGALHDQCLVRAVPVTGNFINPEAMHRPIGYTHVVEVTAGRPVYIAGQVALDPSGAMVGPGDIRTQARQVSTTSGRTAGRRGRLRASGQAHLLPGRRHPAPGRSRDPQPVRRYPAATGQHCRRGPAAGSGRSAHRGRGSRRDRIVPAHDRNRLEGRRHHPAEPAHTCFVDAGLPMLASTRA